MPGPRSPRPWDRAIPGLAHPQRLLSIAPIGQTDAQDIFEAGRDDIGADADVADILPKAPGEPKFNILYAGATTAAIVAGAAACGVAKAIGGLMRFLSMPSPGGKTDRTRRRTPTNAPRRKQPGKLSKFVGEKLARLQRSLSESRHRELTRLLNMLDKEPDKGLRFAIPFGDMNHRGRATPGSRLMERLTDFSLRSLGGGRPADYWEIPADRQFQLQNKYRELANREIRLNRHRRAAYIFAELLSDLESAAAALRDGRHYREAAVIYRERLKRPIDAARCLESGGLWAEAIEEYGQLEMHEKIGDLYVRLDDKQRATVAYQTAAARHRDHSDFASAAQHLRRVSRRPGRRGRRFGNGLAELDASDPMYAPLFSLLGRRTRHAAAAVRAAELATEAADSPNHLTIAHLLADFAGGYPDAAVREVAAESAKQVIGGRLRSANHAEADSLCRAGAACAGRPTS